MTVNSMLSSTISGSVSHSPVGQKAAASASDTSSSDSFGPAYVLSVSGSAQSGEDSSTSAVSNTASTGSSASDTSASGGAAPAGGGGGGGGVSSSSTNSELVTEEIEEAKRKVAAQVGTVAANGLVDSKGNIDTAGLQREITKQAAQAAAQQQQAQQ